MIIVKRPKKLKKLQKKKIKNEIKKKYFILQKIIKKINYRYLILTIF